MKKRSRIGALRIASSSDCPTSLSLAYIRSLSNQEEEQSSSSEQENAPVVEEVSSGSVQRVMAQVMEAQIDIGGVLKPIKVMAIPGAVEGMKFEAYKQLESILVGATDGEKVKAFIDPVITKALPAIKNGISASLVTSVISLFKGAKIGDKIYGAPIKVVGTSHLADLLRQELAANKVHSAILMQYIKNNFMELVSDYPELGEMLMSVIGLGADSSQKKGSDGGKTFH